MEYNIHRAMFVFEIGYLVQHIGTGLLNFKIQKQRTIYGISIDAQICYAFALLARCFWQFDTQLMSMWLTYFEIMVAITLQLYLLYQCNQYKDIIYRNVQDFQYKWYFVCALCLVMACVFHPGKKNAKFFFTLQMFVSFTMFVEAAALIP